IRLSGPGLYDTSDLLSLSFNHVPQGRGSVASQYKFDFHVKHSSADALYNAWAFWRAIVDFTNYTISVLISLVVGLVGFIVAYKIFDLMTPGVHFSDQLKADNRAVAIFL